MISIIIVNYKQIEVTVELLQSIRDLCIYPELEIIVVDNEAEFGNDIILSKIIDNVVYVPLKWNSGFAAANNIGANIAKGDLLYFINNDTVISSGSLHKLERTIIDLDDAGIVCPIIKYYSEPTKIQYAGFTRINRITGRNKILRKAVDSNNYKTEYAHGAAMLMRKSVFQKVGGFNESYFLYYEELDLSEKVKSLGLSIYVNPNTKIYHKESTSTGKDSPLKSYYLTRNRISFMRTHQTNISYKLYILYHFTVSMPINLLKMVLKNKFENANKYIQGSMDGIKNIAGFKKLN